MILHQVWISFLFFFSSVSPFKCSIFVILKDFHTSIDWEALNFDFVHGCTCTCLLKIMFTSLNTRRCRCRCHRTVTQFISTSFIFRVMIKPNFRYHSSARIEFVCRKVHNEYLIMLKAMAMSMAKLNRNAKSRKTVETKRLTCIFNRVRRTHARTHAHTHSLPPSESIVH